MSGVVSILLASVLYSPIIKIMIKDHYFKSEGLFKLHIISHILPKLLIYATSGRHLLIALAIAGFSYILYKKDFRYLRKAIFCVCWILIPFFLSSIRGDMSYYRIYITLIPGFVLFVSMCTYRFLCAYRYLLSKLFLVIIILLYPLP